MYHKGSTRGTIRVALRVPEGTNYKGNYEVYKGLWALWGYTGAARGAIRVTLRVQKGSIRVL